MQHLRPSLLQLPPKHQPNILHQMARELDMSYIRRMVLRPDVIVLQNRGSVEVVHVATCALAAGVETAVVEVLDDSFDFGLESAALGVACAVDGRREAAPEAKDDDLGGGPGLVDCGYQVDVALGELGGGDVVDWVGVVGSYVD